VDVGRLRFCEESMSQTPLNHWCASVDATIDLRTGCNPLEKHGQQAVIVHADAFAPMDAIRDPHDIRQVVDYEVIFLAIRNLENNAHCECLESSILEVMDAIFSIPVVSSAFVSMHKPHVYNGQGTPAISLAMTREQWSRLLK
jgi:dihydroneopterin aldolase